MGVPNKEGGKRVTHFIKKKETQAVKPLPTSVKEKKTHRPKEP